jgi:hypothetical protein
MHNQNQNGEIDANFGQSLALDSVILKSYKPIRAAQPKIEA